MGRSKKPSEHACKVAAMISLVHTTPGLLWLVDCDKDKSESRVEITERDKSSNMKSISRALKMMQHTLQ